MVDTFELTNPQIQIQKKVQLPKVLPKIKDKELDEDNVKYSEADRKRHWKIIEDKIFFNFAKEIQQDPSFNPYEDYEVKPAFQFWKAIASCKRIEDVYINIPETLMFHDNAYIFLYTNEEGKLMRKIDANYQDFEKKLIEEHSGLCRRFYEKMQKYEQQNTNRKYNSNHTMDDLYKKINFEFHLDVPIVITRQTAQNDWEGNKQIKQYRKFKESKTDQSSTSFDQRYLLSRPIKATILRLQYFTKNAKNQLANKAFRIQNKLDIFDASMHKSIINKCTLNMNFDDNIKLEFKKPDEFSFEYQEVKGGGFKEYEFQAEQIVKMIEKNYNIRIKEIVCDFIQDIEGKIWFINCKKIQSETTRTMQDYIAQEGDAGDKLGKNTLAQLTCSVYCKLCGIKFKKDDASKVLTYKLLWELVQHLKKRNIYSKYPYLKNIKVSHNSTRPCRVCNLCYMLVVGEHELIEIETEFAMAQNIPINDSVIRVPIDTKPKNRPALLVENLFQWRLIFYICEISDVGSEHKIDLKNLYFQYKLNNYKTCFKIRYTDPKTQKSKQDSSMQQSSQQQKQSKLDYNEQLKQQYSTLNINLIRVHYFFSEDENIDKFLQDTEIKVRLTQGTDWNSFLAEGSSKTIQHFKNKHKGGQRHSTQILMFFENAKYCTLTLQIGLVCDNMYNTGKLNLYKYNNIYFPDESYHNANDFPAEWMEMFEQPNFDKQTQEDKGIEKYSPKCSKDELNKMIDFNSYKQHSQYKQVKSKVALMARTQSASQFKPLQIDTSTQQFVSPTNFTSNQMFPSTMKSSKPPRAITAKVPNNQQFKRPISEYKIQRPITSTNQQQQKLNRIESADSYKFILDKKKDKSEKDIFKKYDLLSQDEDEDINDSGDEIVREKLMQHFKKMNQMDIEIDNQYEQIDLKNSPQNIQNHANEDNDPDQFDQDQNDFEESEKQIKAQDYQAFLNKKKKELISQENFK